MIRSMPPVSRMLVTSTYMKATVNSPVLEKPASAWAGSITPRVSSRITAPSSTMSGPTREKAISGKTAMTMARESQASSGMGGSGRDRTTPIVTAAGYSKKLFLEI